MRKFKQMDLAEYLYGNSLNDVKFMLNEKEQIEYNSICAGCRRSCKQSFRSQIVQCPSYQSSRKNQEKEKYEQ